MIDLLKNFTIGQILIFIVLLALAFKSVIIYLDWIKSFIQKKIDKQLDQENLKNSIDIINENQKTLMDEIKETNQSIKDLKDTVNLLISSDKDDIKAWITEKHHYFCYDLGYIDDYNLDCMEKRYAHYLDEHGNSFIGELMDEVRALPKSSNVSLYRKNKEGGDGDPES